MLSGSQLRLHATALPAQGRALRATSPGHGAAQAIHRHRQDLLLPARGNSFSTGQREGIGFLFRQTSGVLSGPRFPQGLPEDVRRQQDPQLQEPELGATMKRLTRSLLITAALFLIVPSVWAAVQVVDADGTFYSATVELSPLRSGGQAD